MTAVEWLVQQIETGKIEIVYSDKIHSIRCLPEFVKQAKEMEKEQIIKAHGVKRTKMTAKKIISFPIIGFGIGSLSGLTLEDLYLKLIFAFISGTCLLIGLILLIDKKK